MSSLKGKDVQIVERHVMPVTAENVHEALFVDGGRVAVPGSGHPAFNETKFALDYGCVASIETCVMSLSSFFHLVEVGVKSSVSILDDEGVGHLKGGGGGEGLFLFLLLLLLGSRLLVRLVDALPGRRKAGFLGGAAVAQASALFPLAGTAGHMERVLSRCHTVGLDMQRCGRA
jgi:hypothetical protein